MVVDDSRIFRDVVMNALRRAGIEAAEAADGAQAWELLRTVRPDLILLDLSMPEVSGAVFLRRLRSDRRWAAVPVIVVSGRAESGDSADLARHAVHGRLCKGRFGLSELVAKVAGVLASASAATPPPSAG
jgi:CheY-like chemotaxis protein